MSGVRGSQERVRRGADRGGGARVPITILRHLRWASCLAPPPARPGGRDQHHHRPPPDEHRTVHLEAQQPGAGDRRRHAQAGDGARPRDPLRGVVSPAGTGRARRARHRVHRRRRSAPLGNGLSAARGTQHSASSNACRSRSRRPLDRPGEGTSGDCRISSGELGTRRPIRTCTLPQSSSRPISRTGSCRRSRKVQRDDRQQLLVGGVVDRRSDRPDRQPSGSGSNRRSQWGVRTSTLWYAQRMATNPVPDRSEAEEAERVFADPVTRARIEDFKARLAAKRADRGPLPQRSTPHRRPAAATRERAGRVAAALARNAAMRRSWRL